MTYTEYTVLIGDIPLSQMSDNDLVDWINRRLKQNGRYRIRHKTLLLWKGILRVFEECGAPVTVRQMFYQLEIRKNVPKGDDGYKQTAKNLLNMRKNQIVPYNFVTDHTRGMRKGMSYSTLNQCLQYTIETYRKNIWASQPCHVEIWIEKEALIGVIEEVTTHFDVPLIPCKGYPSETLLYNAAEDIKSRLKPTYIYYFGDFDPTGKDIPRHIEKKLREFGAEFTFEVRAVTEEQIHRLQLPTRPTKKKDTRAKNWEKDSVELDAIPPRTLRKLIEDCIVEHMDQRAWENLCKIEKLERETLGYLVQQLGTSPQFGDTTG